jgi:hypothetical protein
LMDEAGETYHLLNLDSSDEKPERTVDVEEW